MNHVIKLTQIAEQEPIPEAWHRPVDVYKGDNGMTYVVSVYEDDYDDDEDEVLIAIAYPEYPFYAEAEVYIHYGSTNKVAALIMAGLNVVDE